MDYIFSELEQYLEQRTDLVSYLREELPLRKNTWVEHLLDSFPVTFAQSTICLSSLNEKLKAITLRNNEIKQVRDSQSVLVPGTVGHELTVEVVLHKSQDVVPSLFANTRPPTESFGYMLIINYYNTETKVLSVYRVKAAYVYMYGDEWPVQLNKTVETHNVGENGDKCHTLDVAAPVDDDFNTMWKTSNVVRRAMCSISVADKFTHFHCSIGPAKKAVSVNITVDFVEMHEIGSPKTDAYALSNMNVTDRSETEQWWFRGTHYEDYSTWLRAAKKYLTAKELTYLKLNGYELEEDEDDEW